jgi:hypothetical protein
MSQLTSFASWELPRLGEYATPRKPERTGQLGEDELEEWVAMNFTIQIRS